jgi:hypothetical protein
MHRYHDPGQIGHICTAAIPSSAKNPLDPSRPAPVLDSVERVREVKVEEWRGSIQ